MTMLCLYYPELMASSNEPAGSDDFAQLAESSVLLGLEDDRTRTEADDRWDYPARLVGPSGRRLQTPRSACSSRNASPTMFKAATRMITFGAG